jgi:hypothetical protein
MMSSVSAFWTGNTRIATNDEVLEISSRTVGKLPQEASSRASQSYEKRRDKILPLRLLVTTHSQITA